METVQQTEPAKKKPRGRPIEKGGKDPRQSQNGAHRPVADVPDEDDLVVMRRVWRQPKRRDRTAQEKRFREWLESNMATYRREMRELAAERKASEQPAASEKLPPDATGERLRQLALRLLEEDAREHGSPGL